MTKAAIAFFLLLFTEVASAKIDSSPIQAWLKDAEFFGRVTILSSKIVEIDRGGVRGSCGLIHQARVSESYLGNYEPNSIVEFSSEGLGAGGEYVVALRRGSFVSDVSLSNEEYQDCLKKLMDLKALWTATFTFSQKIADCNEARPLECNLDYWVEIPYLLVIPDRLQITEIETRSVYVNGEEASDYAGYSKRNLPFVPIGSGVRYIKWSELRNYFLDLLKPNQLLPPTPEGGD